MDRIVSVSTMAFDGYPLETSLDELAALSVKYVEPASVDKIFQHLVEADFCDARAAWLRDQLAARRLACLSLSAHLDLTGPDSVERFHRRIAFARNVGARCVNSIAGPAGKLGEFRKNILAIADRARDLGVMVALENHGDLQDRDQQVQWQQAGELRQHRDDRRKLHPEELEVVSHRGVGQFVTVGGVAQDLPSAYCPY